MLKHDIPPKHVLFSNPDKFTPQISPNGKLISFISLYNGIPNIWIRSIDKDDAKPITHEKNIGIGSYSWLFDSEHIIYTQDAQGGNNFHIYKINITNKISKDVTPFDNVSARIISYRREFPDEILLGLNKNHPAFHDVYKWDLKNDSLTLVEKNPGNVTGWIADNNLQIKAAMTVKQDGSVSLVMRDYIGAEWQEKINWSFEDASQSSPVGYSSDNRKIYIRDCRNSNTSRLILFDPNTGEEKVIAEDQIYDVKGVFGNPVDHEVIAVTFAKERKEVVVLDKNFTVDFEILKNIDHGDYAIVDSTLDFNKWLILFYKDNGPVSYYLYDRITKKNKFLFYNNGLLAQYKLASTKPISYKSRDGLNIHGYITYPTNTEEKTNLPMVVLVHGGPWSRDNWGYQPTVQWLATRGYAVFQINFRGSAGYGKNFMNAGNKEWGNKMHHDIEDGVKWALENKIANKDKIAIFGSAYGGYEAMIGATRSSDMFRCAVNIVGPLSLNKLAESFPQEWSHFKNSFVKRVGDPVYEKDLLEDRSPIKHLDNISIPVMIAHGKLDPRTDRNDTEMVVRKLKEKNIHVEYLMFEDEGHGFVKQHNTMHCFATAESFLARHLGGIQEK